MAYDPNDPFGDDNEDIYARIPAATVPFADLRDVKIDPAAGDLVLVRSSSSVRIHMKGNAADNMGWLKDQLLSMMPGSRHPPPGF